MTKPQDQKQRDEAQQYMEDVFDLLLKAVGYLLAANAPGLAGCMTLLKDYATVPQLKGIGIFKAYSASGSSLRCSRSLA